MSEGWEIVYEKEISKSLKNIHPIEQGRILGYLEAVTGLPDPSVRASQLKGNLLGKYKYRVGKYRVIVEFKRAQMVILALDVAHRSVVYKPKG